MVKKADMQYEYKYGTQTNKKTQSRVNHNYNTTAYATKEDAIKPSDLKELEYMQQHCDLSNPEEAKKYRTVFNMFCRKYGIKENSSLYIKYDPYKNRMNLTEWPESKKLTKQELQKKTKDIPKKRTLFPRQEKEHKFILPKGYMLIHRSTVDNITELKPTKYTDHYLKKDSSNYNGQYHSTGRIYFVLTKENDTNTHGMGRGKYVYKLVSNISGFYLDYEGRYNNSADRYPDIDSMLGKPVYVKTDVPLKVKKNPGYHGTVI